MSQHYACRFCIALHGLKERDIDKLPREPEEVTQHVRLEHGYPKRSALDILGDSTSAHLAAQLIDRLGRVIAVSRLESIPGIP